MKSRFRRGLGWLVGMAVVLVVLFLFREVIGWFVLRQVIAALARSSGAKVTYGRTSGDVYASPTFHDVLVAVNSDTVTAAFVTVRWRPLSLIRGRLVLSEIRIASPVIRLSGAQSVSGEGTTVHTFPNLEIGRFEIVDGLVRIAGQNGFGRLPSIQVESINVSLALQSQRKEMNISLLEFTSRLCFPSGDSLLSKGVVIEGVSGQFRVTADSISATHFVLRLGSSHAKGTVRFQRRPLGLGFEIEQLNVSLAEAFLLGRGFRVAIGQRCPTGQIQVTGTCYVDSLRTLANLEYAADGLEVLGVQLPRLNGGLGLLDSVVKLEISGTDTAFGVLRANLEFNLRTHQFEGSVRAESLAVQRFEPKLCDFRTDVLVEFSGVLGSLSGDTRAIIRGREPATDSLVVSMTGRIAKVGVDTISANLVYKDGVVELQWLRIVGDVGRLELVGRARRDRLLGECRLERFDLGLLERFWGRDRIFHEHGFMTGRLSGNLEAVATADSWYFTGLLFGDSVGAGAALAGRCVVDVDLIGGAGIAGRVGLGAEDLHVGGIDLTSAQFVWTGPEFDLRLERADVRLQAAGILEVSRGGFDCDVVRAELVSESDTLGIEPFTVRFDGDTLELESLRVNVADGLIELTGWSHTSAGGSSYFRAAGHHLNLRKLQKLLRVQTELWGTADFALYGQQDTGALSLRVVDFEVPAAELRLKRLEVDAALTPGSIDLRSLRLVHQRDTSKVTGGIWLEPGGGLRGFWGGRRTPGKVVSGFDLRFDLADPGIWVFSFLRGIVDVRSGLVYGSLRVAGDSERFELDGRARIVQATLHIPAVSVLVERVNAELTFTDDKVVLDKLTGEAGSGTVICSGTADLGREFMVDSVSYSVECENVSVTPLSNVYALGSAGIVIKWGTGRPLELTGDIHVADAVVAVGFGSAPIESSSPDADSLVYDLRVRADRGVWLRNREADIELAMDLQLRRTMHEQIYTGRLWSRQGNLYYLDHTLRVTHGEIIFGNISRVDPDIRIVAELPVRRSRRQQSSSYPERIVLTLTGTLQQPSFALVSVPPVWDETQIASYLSLSVPADELGAMGQKEAVTRMLSDRLLNYFQTQVTKKVRDFVALDYFEFESGLATGGGGRVTVGKYVGRNLYVSYTQSIASELQPAFSLEYYLNQRNELLAERSADGSYLVLWRLKLKY